MLQLETKIPIPDGDCTLIENFLTIPEADHLLETLLQETNWRQYKVNIYGKEHLSPRLSAWHGDKDATYGYSGHRYIPEPWTTTLNQIKQKVEDHACQPFNSTLLNLYRDGNDAMGWHADDEPELGMNPTIASLSLGASRQFMLKHQHNRNIPTQKIKLQHGTLLVMAGETQENWKHSASRTKQLVTDRINLTFRLIKAHL